jgi:hypothetical protein
MNTYCNKDVVSGSVKYILLCICNIKASYTWIFGFVTVCSFKMILFIIFLVIFELFVAVKSKYINV